MGSANNPDTYGQSTTGTANQIEDGVDFPHSGIIKALSDGMGQNYAIDGFDISSTSATALTVAAGKIFRDGEFVSVSGASLTLSSSYTNGYHLLVAPSGGTPTVVLRNPSAIDKVPDITSGDTIIAVITHTGVNPCSVQFLTVHKLENSLSVGYNSGGYTESGKITGDADSLDITATVSNGHINLIPNGSGRVNISSTDKNDAELVISKDVGSSIGRTGISLISPNSTDDQTGRITLERTSSSAFIGMDIASDSRHGIRFLTGDGSETERMRIDDDGNIGIGTSSPKNKLQVSHTGADGNNGIMIVREDTSTSDTDLLGGIGFDSTDGNVPSSVLESSAYIAALAAEAHGTSDKGADLTFGTAAINENDDTVSTEHMRILSDGKVGIGTSAPEHFLHIDGANDNFPVRVQGNNGNVRINSFGQIQVQNDNSSPVDGATIDDPIWQIGQRDTGVFDISFGNISAMLVSATDKILEMKRSGNSATGAKQMGFFGTTAISQPAAPASVDSLSSTGNPANPEANADAINALITALTNLGLIG